MQKKRKKMHISRIFCIFATSFNYAGFRIPSTRIAATTFYIYVT